MNELLEYAISHADYEGLQPKIVVVSKNQPKKAASRVEYINHYPASDFFSSAKRIYTGGGFNVMRQLEPYFNKHYPLPFDRKFDDQYHRISNWRTRVHT